MNLWDRIRGRKVAPPAVEKSPSPISADRWLLSALNGTAERPSQVDLMATATVNRAVTRISHDLASVPLVIEERSGAEWKKVEPAPRGQRAAKYGDVAGVFERANPREGKTALWIRFHASMELDGAAVLFTDYVNNGAEARGTAPRELRFIRPDMLSAVYPTNRSLFSDPIAYRFTGSGSGSRNLRPDEVLWHVYPDPRNADPLVGLAPAEAAKVYAQIDYELPEYVLDYFSNGARGSLALCTDQTPSEDQRKQLETEINRAHIGRGKRFKVILATHGLKVQELNGRRDTDFPDLFDIITQRVSMIFGVPPAFLSDYGDSGVRANLEEQTPIYVEGTLMPKGALLEQNLTEIVLPRFDPNGNLRARFDWDQTPMVQRMMLARAQTYFTLVGGPILTPNDARTALELKPLLGGDLAYPAAAQPTGIGPVAQPRATRTASLAPSRKWIDDPARHAKRLAAGVSLDRYEKPAEKMVRAYFSQAEARALHAFEHEAKSLSDSETRVPRGRRKDIWDDDVEIEAASGLIARIYARIVNERGPEAAAEVGGSPSDFLITDPEVQRLLDESAYKNGERITGTTKDMLRQVITTANAEGLTVQETAEMIRDVFALRRDQALTIARTETVRAYNESSIIGWKATGLVERIGWLSAHDENVRSLDAGDEFDHAAMDNVTIKLGSDERFEVPGKKGVGLLRFPGDPESTDPGNVINCRCTAEPITEGESRSFRIAPGTFRKLFPKEPLTNGAVPTDKAAV